MVSLQLCPVNSQGQGRLGLLLGAELCQGALVLQRRDLRLRMVGVVLRQIQVQLLLGLGRKETQKESCEVLRVLCMPARRLECVWPARLTLSASAASSCAWRDAWRALCASKSPLRAATSSCESFESLMAGAREEELRSPQPVV